MESKEDRNRKDMDFLKMILENMPEDYASKFASVIDRAREAGVTDTREMRRLLEELQPESVEVWEDHLYSNRDPEHAGMSFGDFQKCLRGQADDFNAEIKPESEAEPEDGIE